MRLDTKKLFWRIAILVTQGSIFTFSQSRMPSGLLARLQLGCPDKSAELYKRMVKCLLKSATSWWVLAVTFSTNGLWTRYFIKNWAAWWWCSNLQCYCRKKLLVILHYSKSFKWTREVIRTQGKCIKTYKNFLKDFVVKQNLTHPKGDFWSYLNHPYKIVIIWYYWTTRNMDPCMVTIKCYAN